MKITTYTNKVSKEYIFIGMRLFRETQSKAMRAYAQSG